MGWLIDVSRSSWAAWSGRPEMRRLGRACRRGSASAVSRTPKSSPTRSASSLRATKPSRSADSSSSHCASSITHSTGRVSAASDSSVSTARPTRNGSAGGPDTSPKATPQRAALRLGQAVHGGQERHQQLVDGGEAEALLRLDGHHADDLHVPGALHGVAEQRRLAHPGLAPEHQRTAHPPADAVEHPAERLLLGAAVDQPHAPR